MLGQRPIEDINDSVGAAEKKIILTLVKEIPNFA